MCKRHAGASQWLILWGCYDTKATKYIKMNPYIWCNLSVFLLWYGNPVLASCGNKNCFVGIWDTTRFSPVSQTDTGVVGKTIISRCSVQRRVDMACKRGNCFASALRPWHESPLTSVILAEHQLLKGSVLYETVVCLIRCMNHLLQSCPYSFRKHVFTRWESRCVCCRGQAELVRFTISYGQ